MYVSHLKRLPYILKPSPYNLIIPPKPSTIPSHINTSLLTIFQIRLNKKYYLLLIKKKYHSPKSYVKQYKLIPQFMRYIYRLTLYDFWCVNPGKNTFLNWGISKTLEFTPQFYLKQLSTNLESLTKNRLLKGICSHKKQTNSWAQHKLPPKVSNWNILKVCYKSKWTFHVVQVTWKIYSEVWCIIRLSNLPRTRHNSDRNIKYIFSALEIGKSLIWQEVLRNSAKYFSRRNQWPNYVFYWTTRGYIFFLFFWYMWTPTQKTQSYNLSVMKRFWYGSI